jgi:hypothetical protein
MTVANTGKSASLLPGGKTQAAGPFGRPLGEPAAEPDFKTALEAARYWNIDGKDDEAEGHHPEAENRQEAQDATEHKQASQ